MNRIFYRKDGSNLILSEKEIVENALQQEADGIKPHYSWYDYKRKESVSPAGWLVVSVWSGVCVVYRRHDEKLIIIEGRQSDFCYR